jgi:hypothetical protein
MTPMRAGSMRGSAASRLSAASASTTFATVGTRDWSVAVSVTPRGAKESTTNDATPMRFRLSAHQNSRSRVTPPEPCAITIAGTRPDAPFGSTSVP